MSEQKSEQKSIEELVDEMIGFTIKAGGDLDMYVDTCTQSVDEALNNLDGSAEMETIYEDAQEFLRIAKLRRDEAK